MKVGGGVPWLKNGVWKLKGMKSGVEGRCPLCSKDEDAIHILLKCLETMIWREQLLCRKWLTVSEELAYKK